MDCDNRKNNIENCNCSYEPCSRKGNCCECVTYHIKSRELPACVFPSDAERTYNRSFDYFAKLVTAGKI